MEALMKLLLARKDDDDEEEEDLNYEINKDLDKTAILTYFVSR